MNSTSPRFSINGIDLEKILTGLLIGLAGVAITMLTMLGGATYHVVIGGMDFSAVATLLASSIFSTLVNLLRKYITDHSSPA